MAGILENSSARVEELIRRKEQVRSQVRRGGRGHSRLSPLPEHLTGRPSSPPKMLFAGLIFCFYWVSAQAEEYCFSQDSAPYNYFASKTVYELVRNRKGRIAAVPNCEPVLVWGLFRHGTRYPHRDQIKLQRDLVNLRDNVERNHNLSPPSGELCYSDLELLRDWNYNVTESMADLLSSTGVSEIYLLAKRLKTDFPLLDATYTEDRFKIRFTENKRTKESADAFTYGLFGRKIDLPDDFIDKPLLESKKNCSNWEKSMNSEGAEKQNEHFINGPFMKELIESVSKRLGFKYQLHFNVIKDIYDMCRFDKAWQPKSQSPWCSAFTKDHLQVMEYHEDLNCYYRSGYGNPFMSMLGCPLVTDLINSFQNRTLAEETKEPGPSAVLNFGSSLNLRSLLVRLGIAHDQVTITADNYKSMEKRQWRTSLISPFAGNFVAVLYKCGEQFKVIFYLNEQYIDYRGCDVGLCNWTYIYERFSPIIQQSQCNLDFCNTSSGTSLASQWAIIFTMIATVLSLVK